MDYQEKLDDVVAYLDSARSLPMSSSIIVNKKELAELLEALRGVLPEDLVAAQAVLRRRDELLTEATANAERLLEAAADEQRRMVSEAEVVQEARIEAGAILRTAQDKAEQMSRDVDGYVDAKLAHLEVSVTNILDTVRQGRERLASPGLYTELAPADEGEETYAALGAPPAALGSSSGWEPPAGADTSRDEESDSGAEGPDAVQPADAVAPAPEAEPEYEAEPNGDAKLDLGADRDAVPDERSGLHTGSAHADVSGWPGDLPRVEEPSRD